MGENVDCIALTEKGRRKSISGDGDQDSSEKNQKKSKKKGEKKKLKSEDGEDGKKDEKENGGACEERNEIDESEQNAKKVYVGGIPYYSTEDDIRSFFEGCGTVTEIDCKRFPETGKFRGIAILTFKLFDGKEGRPKYPRRWVIFPPFL